MTFQEQLCEYHARKAEKTSNFLTEAKYHTDPVCLDCEANHLCVHVTKSYCDKII